MTDPLSMDATRAVVTITPPGGPSQRLPRAWVRVTDGRAEWSPRRFNRGDVRHTGLVVADEPAGRRERRLTMDDGTQWHVKIGGG